MWLLNRSSDSAAVDCLDLYNKNLLNSFGRLWFQKQHPACSQDKIEQKLNKNKTQSKHEFSCAVLSGRVHDNNTTITDTSFVFHPCTMLRPRFSLSCVEGKQMEVFHWPSSLRPVREQCSHRCPTESIHSDPLWLLGPRQLLHGFGQGERKQEWDESLAKYKKTVILQNWQTALSVWKQASALEGEKKWIIKIKSCVESDIYTVGDGEQRSEWDVRRLSEGRH